jgi:hypothetical protein
MLKALQRTGSRRGQVGQGHVVVGHFVIGPECVGSGKVKGFQTLGTNAQDSRFARVGGLPATK